MPYIPLDTKEIQKFKDLANTLRIHTIQITSNVNYGFPTSCASIAEVLAVLFFQTMRLHVHEPLNRHSDRLVLSKGHAAPILYATWAEANHFNIDLAMNFRQIDSDFEAIPTPRLDFIDVHTGSMGCGVSFAVGMAFMGKYFDRADYRVYVIVGDGESNEGIVWEAIQFAGYHQLDNLCVIFDLNRLGANGPTMLKEDDVQYFNRLFANNFEVITVNGHDIEEVRKGFYEVVRVTGKPTAVLAKTIAGKFMPPSEDAEMWHGRLLGSKTNLILKCLRNLIFNESLDITPLPCVKNAPKISIKHIKLCGPPEYKLCENVSTSQAFGMALVKLAIDNERVIAFDSDVKNAAHMGMMEEAFPTRLIQCFAAEQNMIGVAIGATCRDRCCAFAVSFAAYLSRAHDILRIGAISQSNINVVGIDCGISIGQIGPGRMGLEDLALFRSLPNCTVFYPSDAVSCEYACELAANRKGICYIRTTKQDVPVLYKNDEIFAIGKGKILYSTPSDEVLLIGAGITIHECLCAAKMLKHACIPARVLDVFTVKPLDKSLIIKNGKACKYRVVVVEDHYRAGGLGEAVMSELSEYRKFLIKHLYISSVPRSGPPDELMQMYGISALQIMQAATTILTR